MHEPLNINLLNILHATHCLMLCRDSCLILTQCDTHVLIIRNFFSLHFILFYLILTQENSGELKTLRKEKSVYVNAMHLKRLE
jgi:hypothetical protein